MGRLPRKYLFVLGGLLLALAAAFLLIPGRFTKEPVRRAVGKDTVVYKGETVRALKKTKYRFILRRVTPPKGIQEVVAGQVVNRYGVRLNFAVVVADSHSNYSESELKATLKPLHLDFFELSNVSNVEVITSDPFAGRASKQIKHERAKIAHTIEKKVYALMNDVTLSDL